MTADPIPDSEVRLSPSAVAVGVTARALDVADGIAVRDPVRTLTFAEFDLLVGTLAGRLAEETAEPWLPVLVDRSVLSAVAVHAALRAGRPFVPIESSLPYERIGEL
ncbi:MAG: hypothetical protein WCK21_06960, partial [Actinomycetota bacterium]